MELIKKALALFSGAESFVKEMWQWFPILLITLFISLGVLAIISIFDRRSNSMEHSENVHSRIPILRRLVSGGVTGAMISFVFSILFAIFTFFWFSNMCEALRCYNGPLDASIAIICIIELLLCVYFIAMFVLAMCLSLLSFDIKCFFGGLVGLINFSLMAFISFIYAMMWYFSTV